MNIPKRTPRHWELLVTLLVMQIGQSFLSADQWMQRLVFNILFLAVILSAIRALSYSRLRRRVAASIGSLAFILASIAEFHPTWIVSLLTTACYLAVFAILLLSLSERVFRSGDVDLDRIAGAANLYLLLGILFALIFTMLEIMQPGSFAMTETVSADGAGQGLVSALIYFSNVTLTTLGYGDVLPVTRPARTLATLEAVFGQLYLAVFMARLVGMHIANATR
ncbi:MAG: ion channel [Planctomycetota bacterium]